MTFRNTARATYTKHKYEGHQEIIDTLLAFWTPDETNNSADGKVKREDWYGRKREKVGWLCPEAGTSDSGLNYGQK